MMGKKGKTSFKEIRQTGIALAVIATMFFSVTGASAAIRVSETIPIVPGYHWVTTSIGATVLVPNANPQDKAAWIATNPAIGSNVKGPSSIVLHGANNLATPYASTVGANSLSSAGTLPFGGSTLEANGLTSITWTDYVGISYVAFYNSEVHDYWWGSSPYNANAISPSMKWWLSGINVSVSIPAGGSFSGSGGSAVVYAPGQVPNTWQANAYYSYNVNESATFVYSANFQTYGDFLFGSSWYHVQGN